jgi:hypothetical protein
MKKRIIKEVEVHVCDNCGRESQMDFGCFACAYSVCWTCKDEVLIEYAFGVYFTGWADGLYCRPCDMRLSEDECDPLHNAYVEIRSLKDEALCINAGFKKRQTVAEALVERLFNERKSRLEIAAKEKPE